MRKQELAGEERSYIGSALSARGNDCHARTKGVDRASNAAHSTTHAHRCEGARVSKAAYAAYW